LGKKRGLVGTVEASSLGGKLALALLVFKIEKDFKVGKGLVSDRFVTPLSTAEAKAPVLLNARRVRWTIALSGMAGAKPGLS
jgi:hypothetical protein